MASLMHQLNADHDGIARLFAEVSSPDADRRAVLTELIRRLAAHISVEQSVVYPKIGDDGAPAEELKQGLKDDYDEMGRLLIRIERRKIDSPHLPDMVTELKDRFESHVERCGAIGEATGSLSDAEREDMAHQMENAEDLIHSHPHPHLLSLGPLSRLTTRLAARFDRARDRTVKNQP